MQENKRLKARIQEKNQKIEKQKSLEVTNWRLTERVAILERKLAKANDQLARLGVMTESRHTRKGKHVGRARQQQRVAVPKPTQADEMAPATYVCLICARIRVHRTL